MLCLRLSDVLDEQLEGLAWSVVLPAGRMAERGERTGSFIDGLLHLLFSFAVTTLHCGRPRDTFPTIKNSPVLSLCELSLDFLMTGSAYGNMVRVVTCVCMRAFAGLGAVLVYLRVVGTVYSKGN